MSTLDIANYVTKHNIKNKHKLCLATQEPCKAGEADMGNFIQSKTIKQLC